MIKGIKEKRIATFRSFKEMKVTRGNPKNVLRMKVRGRNNEEKRWI